MSGELQEKLNNITNPKPDENQSSEPPKRKRGRPPKNPDAPRAATKKTPQANTAIVPVPDPVIANVIKIPFNAWSQAQSIDEVKEAIKLTDQEALSLSAPVKALMDYYLPMISPIGYVWLSLGLTTADVLTKRMVIIQKHKPTDEKDNKKDGKKDNNNHGSTGVRKKHSGKKSSKG